MGRKPSSTFSWLVFGAAAVVFLAAYARSFQVKPCGDDFGYINEVHRGRIEGVTALFTKSVTAQSYRPLTSVGLWAFGNIDLAHATVWIRVLHLLSMIFYAAVAMLWFRSAGLARAGLLVAIFVMFLHPVLPQAVGSIDGYNSLTSSAFLWLGAWCILHFRDKPLPAAATALICFALGAGFKEYAWGLLPLSMLTVICFWRRRRWIGIVLMTLIIGLAILAAIKVRQYTVPAESPGSFQKAVASARGWDYISLKPADLFSNVVENSMMFVVGTLLFINSVWVYVERTPEAYMAALVAMLLVIVTVGVGLFMLLKERAHAGDEPDGADVPPPDRKGVWIVFLLLSLGAATCPAIIMKHVSEMYVPPLVLPFAALCGLAADGWTHARAPARYAATAVALAALVSSLLTIWWKINDLVDVGNRADRQLRQIVSFLPPDAHDMRVWIIFPHSTSLAFRAYAVFRITDTYLLSHGEALGWPLPNRNLWLETGGVNDLSDEGLRQYDFAKLGELVLGWDAQKKQFFKIYPK